MGAQYKRRLPNQQTDSFLWRGRRYRQTGHRLRQTDPVSCVVLLSIFPAFSWNREEELLLNIILGQEELASIKAISKLRLSPPLLEELRMVLGPKKEANGVCREPQHHVQRLVHSSPTTIWPVRGQVPSRRTGKIEQLYDPVKRRPVLGAGSDHLFATSSGFMSELAAVRSRQLGHPVGGVTYAAVLARHFATFQKSGSLTPTAKVSNLSEPAVSSETTTRHIYRDMSWPLSYIPNGTTRPAHVKKSFIPAGEYPNKTPIFVTGDSDTCAFLSMVAGVLP